MKNKLPAVSTSLPKRSDPTRYIRGTRHLVLATSMLAAMLLNSGCVMVGPDFKKPDADVSEKWIDGTDLAVKTESVEYREWWKNFNDPATVDRIAREAARRGKIVGVRCSALSEDRDDDTLWERVRTCQAEEVPSAKLVPEEVQVVLA